MTSARHHPDVGLALVVWYLFGVVSVCTTKLLLSMSIEEGGVPSPLVMTFQQMLLGSATVKFFLVYYRGQIQPWPKEPSNHNNSAKTNKSHPMSPTSNNNNNSSNMPWWNKNPFHRCWYYYLHVVSNVMVDYLLLAGLFNGLDFLASNTSFSKSSASFVETIKASEPITTTALAIWWGIDRLGTRETASLAVLITGVLLSTYANAVTAANDTTSTTEAEAAPASLEESIKTCLTVMMANMCFAFRAMSQKLLRQSSTGSSQQLDDFNMYFRMLQTGAASLVVPVLLFQPRLLVQVLFGRPSWHVFGYYWGISAICSISFASYNLAGCYILTRISVVQYSGIGCLRRLFAIVATSIAFGVPISGLGGVGILMSLVGFSGFTHYRFQRQGQSKKGDDDEGKNEYDNEEEKENEHAVDINDNKNNKASSSSQTDVGGEKEINGSLSSGSGCETAPLSTGSGSSMSEDLLLQQQQHV